MLLYVSLNHFRFKVNIFLIAEVYGEVFFVSFDAGKKCRRKFIFGGEVKYFKAIVKRFLYLKAIDK